MCFKLIIHLFFLIFIVSSCQLKLNEEKVTKSDVEFTEGQCLDNAISFTENFLEANEIEFILDHKEEIKKVEICFSEAVGTFKKNVRGIKTKVYSPEEIKIFIEKQFFKNNKTISEKNLNLIFLIKMLFVGGESDSLTFDELNQLQLIIPKIYLPALKSFFYFNKYLDQRKSKDQLNLLDLKTAESRMIRSSFELIQWTDGRIDLDLVYDLLVDLSKENSNLIKSSTSDFEILIKEFASNKRIYDQLLELIFGFDQGIQRKIIEKNQLKLTLQAIIKGYFLFEEMDLSQEGPLLYYKLESLIPEFHELGLNIIQINNHQKIKNKNFLKLHTLLKLHFKKTQFSSSALNQIFQISDEGFLSTLNFLVQNVFLNQKIRLSKLQHNQISHSDDIGIDQIFLDQFFLDFKYFINSQLMIYKFIDQNPGSENRISVIDFKNSLFQIYKNPSMSFLIQDQQTYEAAMHFDFVQNLILNYSFNKNGFLNLDFPLARSFSRDDLILSNLAHNASRFLIRSLTQNPDLLNFYINENHFARADLGLTLPEAEAGFLVLRQLLIDLKMIESDNTTFMSSRFREASLFVSNSNGDDRINLAEIHDLILHLISGINRGDAIRSVIQDNCSIENSFNPINESCFLKEIINLTQGLDGLNSFIIEKASLEETSVQTYVLSLLKASGYKENELRMIGSSDYDLLTHVIQYIEILFLKYDTNQDQVLDKNEALLAFPVFEKTIKSILGVIPNGERIKDDQLPGVFIYLLKYKAPPKGLSQSLRFINFISKPELWIIQTDRKDIADILNFISEAQSTVVVPVESTQ